MGITFQHGRAPVTGFTVTGPIVERVLAPAYQIRVTMENGEVCLEIRGEPEYGEKDNTLSKTTLRIKDVDDLVKGLNMLLYQNHVHKLQAGVQDEPGSPDQ